MKKIFLTLMLSGIAAATTMNAQTMPYATTGTTIDISDTSAHFVPAFYPNDTVPATVWLVLGAPISDTLGPITPPQTLNYTFNFFYYDFACGSTQTFWVGITNSVGTFVTPLDSVTLLPCPTGIAEPGNGQPPIRLMPMPVTDRSAFMLPTNDDGTLMIYDASGRMVAQSPINAGIGTIEKGPLPSGTYVYAAQTANAYYAGHFLIQ